MPPEEILDQEVENTEVEETTDDVSEQTESTEESAEGSEDQDASPGEEGDADEEESEGDESEEDEESDEGKTAINTKFKAGVYNKETRALEQKEYEIDKRFHGLMKDPEGEKLIRELHEKAYGLDSIKDRFTETRNFANQVVQENMDINKSINDLRGIYQTAVKTGNMHKLDGFFEKLQIPQDVVLSYALAKVQLNEMEPSQRQATMQQLESEKRAELLAQQQSETQEFVAAQTHQLKQMALDTTLAGESIAPLAKAFDERFNKPGAFKEACIKAGQLAWYTEKKDLTPAQTVQAVIANYNLTALPMVPPAKAGQGPAGASAAGKPVVKRPTNTIPNIQGRSNSPLKSKPKSMDELLKYRKEQHGF